MAIEIFSEHIYVVKNTGIMKYVSNGSEEMRDRSFKGNFPGFDYPLTFSPIQDKHKPAMIKALWSSHKELRGWIGWARYFRSWDLKAVNRFLDDHIHVLPPSQHFVFFINKEVVGMGSLIQSFSLQTAQVAVWTTAGYQGKGIGSAIVNTLEDIAWNTWGYTILFYEHDCRNETSKHLAQKCGFKFSHTKNVEKDAENESGFWYSWVKFRPKDLPPAIIQGRPIEDFTQP